MVARTDLNIGQRETGLSSWGKRQWGEPSTLGLFYTELPEICKPFFSLERLFRFGPRYLGL